MEVKKLAESLAEFINDTMPVAEKPRVIEDDFQVEIIFATKTGGKQFSITVEEMENCSSCGDINWRFEAEKMGWVCNQCGYEMNMQP